MRCKVSTFFQNNRENAKKSTLMLCISTFIHNFAPANAQMAELVDALVSNTNAARRAGSIPALGTPKFNEIPCKHLLARDFFD